MEKSIFEQMGGTYRQEGDYLLPNLTVPEIGAVGIWGQRHLRYIKEHRRAFYTSLQLSSKLDSYLADIDRQAQEQLDIIIQEMAQAQKITAALKATDPMAWVGRMNNIRSIAEEIVNAEIIFT